MLDKNPGATILHNLICSKAVPEVDPRARRHAGAHPGRPLVHQGGHGRDRRGVRRRALGPLLLPRQLPGRLRASSPPSPSSRSCRPVGPAAVASCAGPSSATPPRARSTPRSTIRHAVIDAVAAYAASSPAPTRTASTASPSTSATGGSTCGRRTPSRCCASTSRPRTQSECDEPRRRGAGRSSPEPTTDSGDLTMALDPQLLEILACPEDKGPLLYFEDEDSLYNPRLKRRYEITRRHPRHADRRGRDRRRRRARPPHGQGRGRGHRADVRGAA